MDNQSEIELDLGELCWFLLKNVWIIVASILVCGGISFLICNFLIAPEYEASTRIYVLNRSSGTGVSYADYQVSNQIVEDYKVLITGQNVTKEVIRQLELDMTADELERKIIVTAPENTRVLQIAIRDTDPQQAMDIANCVRQIASTQIQQIMDVDSVNLVYEAELPENPAAPDVLGISMLSAAMGLLTSVGILAAVHIVDDTIRTEEDVERYLGISVMGAIPMSAEMANKPEHGAKGRRRGAVRRRNER